jgi:hypothetical protein
MIPPHVSPSALIANKGAYLIPPHFVPIFHAKKHKRNGFPLRILPMFAIAQDPAFCPTYED